MASVNQPAPIAWRQVWPPMALLAIVLTALSERYGFERDELYFRQLRPAWGYVDQPPLTPLLARAASHLSDHPWALRIPATAAATVSVLVIVLIVGEVGGDRRAQTLAAWAYAFAATPLLMGHVLLTASLDLAVWPALCLFVLRVVVRGEPRWWLAAGLLTGLSTYNKLLIVLLLVALAVGLLAVGPRHVLRSRWLLLGAVVAVVLALPNVAYQASHSWPQLTMGRALSRKNAGSVRIVMWPYLLLLLGPPLVPIWLAGLIEVLRRPQWRRLRFLAVAFGVLLIETFVGGGQLYYPIGLLSVIFAVGCVPAANFLARSAPWRRTAAAGIALNAVVSAVIALPLLPLSALAASPVPSINQTAADQVGWPDYVRQIAAVYHGLSAGERSRSVIVTSNYGESGAIVRYGGSYGLPRPYSGQNQLWFDAQPPSGTATVLVVGGQLKRVQQYFGSCSVRLRLRNSAGVDNEEQDEPVAICRAPSLDWPALWPLFRHYD